MDITELPEELFFDIVKYLPASDLFSCSLVNYSWRNAINNNEIWQHVCKNLVNSNTGEELNNMKSLVTDCSECNPYSAQDFEPLCKWRKMYMKWLKLKNNCREGKYNSFTIDVSLSDNDFYSAEFNNDKLLIVSDDSRALSIWDVKNVPYYQETIEFALSHVRCEFVKLCNNYLVIVQCNLLQVYYNTGDGFQLLYKSLFDKDELQSQMLPEVDITQWYCTNINLYPCDLMVRCEQNGDKFIGVMLDGDYNKSVLHIWDLSKQMKVVEEKLPQSSGKVTDVNLSVADNYLLIMMLCDLGVHNNYDSVTVYDLKSLLFLEFKLNFSYRVPAYIFYKSFILAVDEKWRSINVWKVDSNFNTKIECEYVIGSKCLNVEGSHLLIGGKDTSQNSLQTTVCVFNLSDLKCVYKTNVSYFVDFISLIQSTFLVLGGFSCRRFLSFIDIVSNCNLYGIENDDCIFVNPTHSKLITRVQDQFHIISFW